MRLKIAVCDDDAIQRGYLCEVAAAWAKREKHLLELRQYGRGEDFFFDYSEEKDFDILLLDVEMPGMNGIELAKKVRSESAVVQIIFITGYYEYFGDGFDVSALHYLLKPVDDGKLCPVLDRAVSNLSYRLRSIWVVCGEGSVKVALSDIIYVEAENVYVAVHTRAEKYRMRMALGKLAEQLDETFFKVHRSFIVNLNHVQGISRGEVTMVNGDKIPLSRGMYGEVHAALIRWL